jgi:hypothetical protein
MDIHFPFAPQKIYPVQDHPGLARHATFVIFATFETVHHRHVVFSED